MIKQEFYGTRPDGVNLYRTYSDDGHRIIQTDTGAVYDEAVDVENSGHIYAESEEMIDPGDPPDGMNQAAEYLLKTQMMQMPPEPEEEDYFNEHEPEPDYFN